MSESFLFRRALFRLWAAVYIYRRELRVGNASPGIPDFLGNLAADETLQMEDMHWFLSILDGWVEGKPCYVADFPC